MDILRCDTFFCIFQKCLYKNYTKQTHVPETVMAKVVGKTKFEKRNVFCFMNRSQFYIFTQPLGLSYTEHTVPNSYVLHIQ